MKKYLENIHGLRLCFWLFMVFLMISAAFTGDKIITDDWRIFQSLIIPSLVPIMFFLIPLDITMCSVQLSSCDKSNDVKKSSYRLAIWVDIILIALLLLAWLPFIKTLTV